MRKVVPLERDVQQAITDALELAGFTVRHTSAFRQKGSSGVSLGVPDLLVFVPGFPWVYIGIEVKRPGGKLSADQTAAVEREEYAMVDNPVDALEFVRAVLWCYADQDEPAQTLATQRVEKRINSVLRALGGR